VLVGAPPLGEEAMQAGSVWSVLTTKKPVVTPPVVTPNPTKGDAKKEKKKRHSCGKGANYLITGAATLAASALIL